MLVVLYTCFCGVETNSRGVPCLRVVCASVSGAKDVLLHALTDRALLSGVSNTFWKVAQESSSFFSRGFAHKQVNDALSRSGRQQSVTLML